MESRAGVELLWAQVSGAVSVALPPTDLRLEMMLARTGSFGILPLVEAAFACVDHSFGLLSEAPWISSGSAPLLYPALDWACEPSTHHAQACAEVFHAWERHADAAEAASTDVGDWWTFAAVEAVAMIPAAIALASGLSVNLADLPICADASSEQLLTEVCLHFRGFPSDVPRSDQETLHAIASALLAWARDGDVYYRPVLRRLPPRSGRR
jgi:hypothetical protein